MSSGDGVQVFRRTYPKVAQALDAQGWVLDRASNGHIRFTSSTGATMQAPATPGDSRGWLNTIGRLKRKGLDLSDVPEKEYVAPPFKEAVSGNAAAIASTPKYMNIGAIVKYLEMRPDEVRGAGEGGLFGPRQHPEGGSNRGIYYLASAVDEFKNFGYRDLYPAHRKYKPRKAKEVIPEPKVAQEPVGHRMSFTMSDLAAAIERAILPKVKAEVLKALREYHRER